MSKNNLLVAVVAVAGFSGLVATTSFNMAAEHFAEFEEYNEESFESQVSALAEARDAPDLRK